MKTIINKSDLFKTAWSLVRETGKSFAVCLSRAWRALKLRSKMLKGSVTFTFEKVDGKLRKVTGTLYNLPDGSVKGTGSKNYKTVSYFDAEKGRFGSFRIENLINIY